MIIAAEQAIPLGKTNLRISPMGLGTWAFGDRFTWGFGSTYTSRDVAEAFEISTRAGINFIDTAEIYGMGNSERLLGPLLASNPEPSVVASKVFPYPWRLSGRSLRRALQGSLKRLGLEQLDLYQIHWPFPPVSIENWLEALAQVMHEGLVTAAGVSNYNLSQMRRAQQTLAKHDLFLASNQVHFSLLHREPEWNGLLQACQDDGVTFIAYSPLAQGLLTGKYSIENPPPRMVARSRRMELLKRLPPLLELMREISAGHGGKTLPQIATNWVICKGAVPIPGAKSAKQALDNVGALGWRLSSEEVRSLDAMSERVCKGS